MLIGATPDGKKELIAIHDGHRESEQSWKELLLDCKALFCLLVIIFATRRQQRLA